MCLTTLDLEDLFSQSFFAFEKWKEKMKKNDAVLTSMKCKMDQEKTGASFPRNSGNWYLGQEQKNSRERC